MRIDDLMENVLVVFAEEYNRSFGSASGLEDRNVAYKNAIYSIKKHILDEIDLERNIWGNSSLVVFKSLKERFKGE